jgi:murein L,D-transpeptidase YcbB/YkuD
MRYLYLLILTAAALAYPLSTLTAMERAPSGSPAYSELAPMQALEALAADYRSLAQRGGWPAFKVTSQKIEPLATDSRIATVRDILTIMGDYKGSTPEQPAHYDAALVEAVQHFQRRHGLTDDGVIGRETQLALAVPVEKRLRQIEGTHKRMAEFTPDATGRYLVVNLPEFMLRGFDAGQQVLEMKVIIGTPKDRTPLFTKEMTYVSFNPHWGVPIRIAAEEMLPKILENPSFFAEQDYAVYELTAEGRTEIDPATIDWANYGKEHFPFLLRQRPGKGNALGKIKFGLKNSNAIYMHDTSAPKLFARDVRAFSHGCMRLEKPYEMAKFAFAAHERMPPERLDALYHGEESRILTIPSIPVHTVYWSAWVDAEGKAHFRKDIYGLD